TNGGSEDRRAPRAVWPRLDALQAAAGAFLLMVANLLIFNVFVGSATTSTTGNRIGRYVGESPWTLGGWGARLVALIQASVWAVGGAPAEGDTPVGALLSPLVVVSVALALLGLWVCARRGQWLPLLVTASVLVSVSLLNGRVEPIVPRVRHYATL